MKRNKRALISVYHKDGIVELANFLKNEGFELISTGGTKKIIDEAGLDCTDVSSVTSFPEMMNGRLKTLHPKIFGGILADREQQTHLEQLTQQEIQLIDLVVVNFYPFEKVISDKSLSTDQAIELIDIGGPSLVRAAAKNHKHTVVLTASEQYQQFIEQYKKTDGNLDYQLKREYAAKAFTATRRYDAMISDYFNEEEFPQNISLELEQTQLMRYGENPHQRAAAYKFAAASKENLFSFKQLQGKELSFNNLTDLDGLLRILRSWDNCPTAAIVKHANPCGIGCSDDSIEEAFSRAYDCDKLSAFGGIFGFNRPFNEEIAAILSKIFLEIIAAPEFSPRALAILAKKKNLRLLQIPEEVLKAQEDGLEWRAIDGGLLLQSIDPSSPAKIENAQCVSKIKPSKEQLKALDFANRACQQVKSNAIVLCQQQQTVGIGAGQMSRVDACNLALLKAGDKAKGSVLGSDAFFPFRDSIDLVAKNGVACIVQPGGSVRDKEVIEAADEHGLVMLFTGIRHFRH